MKKYMEDVCRKISIFYVIQQFVRICDGNTPYKQNLTVDTDRHHGIKDERGGSVRFVWQLWTSLL